MSFFNKLIGAVAVFLSIAGCTGSSETAKLHLVFFSMPSQNRADPLSAAAMDCLLVNVRGTGVAETFSGKTFSDGVQASCLNLGTVSTAVGLADASRLEP